MKIKSNVPLAAEEQSRQTWPLADMKVDDVVDIKDKSKWRNASRYAHAVGGKQDMKFSTKWLKKENVGRIRRVK